MLLANQVGIIPVDNLALWSVLLMVNFGCSVRQSGFLFLAVRFLFIRLSGFVCMGKSLPLTSITGIQWLAYIQRIIDIQ